MYIDTNIFVLAHLSSDDRGEAARRHIKGISSENPAYVSPLVFDEMIWILVKKKVTHIAQIVNHLYSIEGLKIVPVGESIPKRSLKYLDLLKPRDAFHAAIMEENRITEIVSTNSDFDKVEMIKRIKV